MGDEVTLFDLLEDERMAKDFSTTAIEILYNKFFSGFNEEPEFDWICETYEEIDLKDLFEAYPSLENNYINPKDDIDKIISDINSRYLGDAIKVTKKSMLILLY